MRWSQGDAQGKACYNYYTPNNYPCGCAATAFAQILCYFRWPQSQISVGDNWYKGCVHGQNGITVDWQMGVDPDTGIVYPVLPSVFTGPAFGGPYDWDNMPTDPENGTLTDAMRQSIGLLTRDCGISLRMEYSQSESSAYVDLVKLRLVDQFGYANAVLRNYGTISVREQRNAMLASFDIGSPCVVGISGHALVADGYGYSDGRLYIHFNYGWGAASSETAWYTPPETDEENSDYPIIKDIIYNIYTPETCSDANRSILSGRVVDEDGNPVIGQIVVATDKTTGETFDATTGENGIYAFLLPAPSTYTIIVENGDRSARTVRSIAKCTSDGVSDDGSRISSGGAIGNLHGVTLMPMSDGASEGGQTWYVDAESGDDSNHGLTAAKAFASIQKAIDSAGWGDKIVVNDGVYGAIVSENQLLTIESVNGACKTIIDGGGTVRAADLASGSSNAILTNTVLRGFTVRNGYAAYGGGGTTFGTIEHCIVSNNTASIGGGSWGGHRVDCIFTNNKGDSGGGMAYGTMERCVVTNNTATLGGGTYYVNGSNGIVADNTAADGGGGSYYGSLNHCTFYGNSAKSGGGMYGGKAINSIFLGNVAEAGNDTYRTDISYSCATWVEYNQGNGDGIITDDPCFVAADDRDFHLAETSPCINAGREERHPDVYERDIEGNLRIRDGRTDMGAYEADLIGIASVIVASAVGGGVVPQMETISSGDNVTVMAYGPRPFLGFFTNGVLVATERTYTLENVEEDIVLTAEFDLAESSMTIYANAVERDVLTDGNSPGNALPLQAAIDVSLAGDTIVVADGVYSPIQTENKSITIRSANGAGSTIIDGGGTNRCATLGTELTDRETHLVGLTLRNGHTAEYGGGVLYGSLEDCVLVGNAAYGGGGAERAVLKNCIIATNTASYGGGVEFSDLEGCSLIGNIATLTWGGGARASTLVDCLIEDNWCAGDGGGTDGYMSIRCIYRNNKAANGGGAHGGFLQDCLLVGNEASYDGGGCYGEYYANSAVNLVNCTVVDNVAGRAGGGIYSLTTPNAMIPYGDDAMCYCAVVNNSIVMYNTLASGLESNYATSDRNGGGVKFQYCCSSPLPKGDGNLSADPDFVNATKGDFRLSQDSPCINKGADSYIKSDVFQDSRPGNPAIGGYFCSLSSSTLSADGPDLVGNPRIAFGVIDIGAYECMDVPLRKIDYSDIWGEWSDEDASAYSVPESVSTWDEFSRILWQARDAYVKSGIGAKPEIPPGEDFVVLSLGAMSVPDNLMTSDPPVETEMEYGVPIWRLRVFEDTNTCSLVAVAGKSAFELSSSPSYLAKAWVDTVYGPAPSWLDANEADAWYAKRSRSRIGWFVTLVPQSQWSQYCANRDEEVAGVNDGDEAPLVMNGIKVDMDTGIHGVSVRSISAGETRFWGKASLAETNWTYKGFSLQSPGTTAAGVHSVSNQMFVTATFSETTVDSDGDGIPDVVEERVYQTNPHKADTSGDGLSDWEKVYHYDLNPHVRDTAGDGVDDAEKILSGVDPRLPISAEAREAVMVKIRYYYDDDDRLTDTWVGIGGASTSTRLSPAGNPKDIRERPAR